MSARPWHAPALELIKAGKSDVEVAQAVGVSRSSVHLLRTPGALERHRAKSRAWEAEKNRQGRHERAKFARRLYGPPKPDLGQLGLVKPEPWHAKVRLYLAEGYTKAQAAACVKVTPTRVYQVFPAGAGLIGVGAKGRTAGGSWRARAKEKRRSAAAAPEIHAP